MPGRGSSRGGAGASSGAAGGSSSFAHRVAFSPLDLEETSGLEAEYLLGGGVAASQLKYDKLDVVSDHRPMTPGWVRSVTGTASGLALVFSALLLAVSVYELRDSANADEGCPLLVISAVVAGFAALVSALGLAAASRGTDKGATETMFFIHHFGAFVSVFLLVLLAVGTLMHWDVTGEPIHDLFHRPESVGVRYRFAVWGLALAAALSLVASMFGTLGRSWYDGDGAFRLSYRSALAVQMVVGLSVFALGLVMWAHGEVKSPAGSPVYMIGSMVGGAAFFAISAAYLGASDVPTLSGYLVWAPMAALLLMAFSVANAVSAEPQSVAPPRHHNQLLSGLIGVWGQIFTVVSIVSASRWRFYLHMESPVPVGKK